MSTESVVSFNIPLWQFAGAIVLTQVFIKGITSDISFHNLIEGLHTGLKHVIWDSPVIAFTGTLTYFAHQIIPNHNPNFSLTSLPGAEGSLKVAAFVCGVFALKSLLSNYFNECSNWYIKQRFIQLAGRQPNEKDHIKTVGDLVREGIISHFLPLTLCTFGVYYAAIPLKLTQIALYTAGLMGVVKLLGKGIEHVIADERISRMIDLTNSWVNVESPLSASTSTPPSSPSKGARQY